MARPMWSGSISFGLVNVPVQLVAGVRDVDLHFRQLHAEDGAPIRQRRVCAKECEEIAFDEIGRGIETDDGTQVVLTDDELAAVAPRRTRTIDVEAFVDLGEVPPVLFDTAYVLLPAGAGEGALRAYVLLTEVMRRAEQGAIARFVLRTREHVALVRERAGRLELTTLRFGDEVRSTDGIDGGAKKAGKAQVDQAVELIEALSADWEPEQYEDRFKARLEEVVRRKQQGETIKAAKPEAAPSAAPDLMAALKQSLEAARSGSGRFGGPADQDEQLSDLTKDELLDRARAAELAGRSKMTKDELVDALSAPGG